MGRDFLNGEEIGGELLSARLAAGPPAPETALQYAVEIGKALAAAHGRGLTHGGLCPERILIASDGAAHLLDPQQGASESAARYRSPEQVRGEAADWRSDLFSFGVLLYEMACGRRAFSGAGEELDEAILSRPPAALSSQSMIHVGMEGVIAGCLEKDRARRRQRAQNAVVELKLAGRLLPAIASAAARRRPSSLARLRAAPVAAPPPLPAAAQATAAALPEYWVPSAHRARGGAWRGRMPVIGLATLALAASGVAAVLYLHQRPAPVVKFSVATPEHASYPGTPAVSPDGQSLTFSALGPEGRRMLWLRALDETHAKVIPGTEGGFAPFWSPDSESIGFFANNELKKVRVRGATPETHPEALAPADAEPGGGTWNRDGTILFAPGMHAGFYTVAAAGGKLVPVLKPDTAKSEHAFLWPQFLPDGRHFVFFAETGVPDTTGVYAASLDRGDSRKLISSQTNAVYSTIAGASSARSGYLLYMKDRDLVGQAFNASRLTLEGAPITLASDIGSIRTLDLAPISVSDNAVLVYQSVGAPLRQLVWMDRNGRQIGTLGEGGMWGPPRISPDGVRVAASRLADDNITAELWLFDGGGNASRAAENGQASEAFPVWSPDGTRIAFWSNPRGVKDLYARPAGAGLPEAMYRDGNDKYPTDWSRDGRFLLFHEQSPGTQMGIWALSLADRRAAAVLDTLFNEGYPALSPDGKWLAYQSDDSGRFEVYVQSFDGLAGGTRRRWQVSTDAGYGQSGLPRWRGDGNELFFMTMQGDVMSVSVAVKNGEFSAGVPQPLFESRPLPKSWNLFDVSRDGGRFLLNLPLEWSNSSVITVMTNWTKKLNR